MSDNMKAVCKAVNQYIYQMKMQGRFFPTKEFYEDIMELAKVLNMCENRGINVEPESVVNAVKDIIQKWKAHIWYCEESGLEIPFMLRFLECFEFTNDECLDTGKPIETYNGLLKLIKERHAKMEEKDESN